MIKSKLKVVERAGRILSRLDSDVHIVPEGDLKEHQETRSCWCDPRLIQEGKEDNVIVVHASMDGRELIELHGIN